MPPPAPKRLPAPQRRRLMLEAAVHVFGEHGYAGATTDAIAREAGVSQAYVVRTFGSKESLYSEAAAYTFDAVREAFRSAPVPAPRRRRSGARWGTPTWNSSPTAPSSS